VRIIAGEFRGTNLFSPKDGDTRPMLDRVKEAVFSILGGSFPGQRALDLFAGTGSLGLEALSRGAAACTFVESDPKALEVLRRNVEKLRLEARSLAVKWDALLWRPEEDEKFDLLFYDPPYRLLQGDARTRTRTIQRFVSFFATLGTERAQGAFHFPRDLLDPSELKAIPGLDLREYGASAVAIGRNSA